MSGRPLPPGERTGTPIGDELDDELTYGVSALRFRPDPQMMLPPVLWEEITRVSTAVPEDEPFSQKVARARATPRTTSQPEGQITAQALEYLNALPHTFARKVHQSAMTGGGEPDIDACCRGRSVKIEMKRPDEEPTGRQMKRLRTWQQAGALVGWACSLADVEALLAHVSDLDWTNPLTGPGDPVAPPG